MKEKRCRDCGESKPLTEFYKHSGCKFGRNSRCKVCLRKENTTDKRRARHRRYYRCHRTTILQRLREQYAADPAYREKKRKLLGK